MTITSTAAHLTPAFGAPEAGRMRLRIEARATGHGSRNPVQPSPDEFDVTGHGLKHPVQPLPEDFDVTGHGTRHPVQADDVTGHMPRLIRPFTDGDVAGHGSPIPLRGLGIPFRGKKVPALRYSRPLAEDDVTGHGLHHPVRTGREVAGTGWKPPVVSEDDVTGHMPRIKI
jgi:hypothetical protein